MHPQKEAYEERARGRFWRGGRQYFLRQHYPLLHGGLKGSLSPVVEASPVCVCKIRYEALASFRKREEHRSTSYVLLI